MDKLTKTAILLSIQIFLAIFFFGFSDKTEIGATVIFPIAFSITFFFIVLTIFEINFESKKQVYMLAFFIGGIALFSTAIGYHYNANAINNLIMGLSDRGLDINAEKIVAQINFMDEYFSHWIMYAGLVIVAAAVGFIYFLSREEIHKKKLSKAKRTENKLLDMFITTFMGTATGVVCGFLAISGNVIKHSLITVTIILPIYLIKTKDVKLTHEGLEMILFGAAAISSFIALTLTYYFIFATGYVANPFM